MEKIVCLHLTLSSFQTPNTYSATWEPFLPSCQSVLFSSRSVLGRQGQYVLKVSYRGTFKSEQRHLRANKINFAYPHVENTVCQVDTEVLHEWSQEEENSSNLNEGPILEGLDIVAASDDKANMGCKKDDIRELCRKGSLKEAAAFLKVADEEKYQDYLDSCVCFLQCCIQMKALEEGKQLHSHLNKIESTGNILLWNTLINLYIKCGNIEDAQQVFNTIAVRNIFTWTMMIAGYAHQDQEKRAIDIFKQMQEDGIRPNNVTFVSVLAACAGIAAIEQGKLTHAIIVKGRCQLNLNIGNTIIDMYAKSRCIKNGCQVFDQMPMRNVVSWNTIISGHVQHNDDEHALKLYKEMQKEGLRANKLTFVSILSACGATKALEQGKLVHADFLNSRHEMNTFVGSTLVDMYIKCGIINEACQVFNMMREHDVVSLNVMLFGYAQANDGKRACKLFEQMQHNGFKPNSVSFITVLSMCASNALMEHGKCIHAGALRKGFRLDIGVGNTLVDMYSKCGSINDARQVFDSMPVQDIVSWNAMVSGYAQLGNFSGALEIFHRMQQLGIQPDKITFVSVLSACSSDLTALENGRQLHMDILKAGCELDVFVGSALLGMYAKSGYIDFARQIFDRMPVRNVVSWNSMIKGYTQTNNSKEAIQIFSAMQNQRVEPDIVTFINILNACADSLTGLQWGKQVHARILKLGCYSDVFVGSALIDTYAKSGSVGNAWQVFDKIFPRNVVVWNAMIGGYALCGDDVEVLTSFEQMQQERLEPSAVTFANVLGACTGVIACLGIGRKIHATILKVGNVSDTEIGDSLIDMYAKCRSIADAQAVFDRMTVKDNVSWTAMIVGYGQLGHASEAIQIFAQMREEEVKLDKFTFASIVKACANIAALECGKQIHADFIKAGCHFDTMINNTLIDMYAKCGSIEYARIQFDMMLMRDVVSWNSMIAGYAQYGDGKKALNMLEEMLQEGTMPNGITFISLLSACSHACLVDEACHHFIMVCQSSGITMAIQHCACIVDLLGRAGKLDEALEFMLMMPLEPTVTLWLSLLAATSVYCDLQVAKSTASHVVGLDPHNAAALMLLSNMYPAARNGNVKFHKTQDFRSKYNNACISAV